MQTIKQTSSGYSTTNKYTATKCFDSLLRRSLRHCCWRHPISRLPLLQYTRDEELARLIRTAHQRPAGRVQEAQLIAASLPLGKLLRRHVLDHLQVSIGRLHVLAECQTVDAHRSQLLHGLFDLGVRLAQAEHNRGLGDQARIQALHIGQHLQRLAVAGTAIAHERRQQLDRLDVVRKNVQAGLGDRGDVVDVAAEIGRQTFDEDARISRAEQNGEY